ncbi:MAG: glycoside hydrolase family 15 protein [Gammaproteobacteria bacterium]|nr:glycoside hydrolase family 15 protein [Gammaproteobacteria bacterium]
MYDYGLIGNCQTAALVNGRGSVEWMCMPRPDSAPVFGRLLDADGGHFSIAPARAGTVTQNYLPNTNVLITRIDCVDGGAYRITDFCPRFEQHGRMYRPIALFRLVEPLNGLPTIKVACRVVNGWDKQPVHPVRGNSHVRFEIGAEHVRLTTNMPLTYLCDELLFALNEPLCFALTWSCAIEDELTAVTRRFLDQTVDYWQRWVKHCSIPSLYQRETIRSALTLKLHCYEDTGAILAALTTSLPEQDGARRNWDYRYCWLRDAYFVVSAFNNLSHFEEMEGFIKFMLGIALRHEHSRERLRPVYALDQSLPLPEMEYANWTGFRANTPVRGFNQAAEHVQNDVYGEMILTLGIVYRDERFQHLRTREHEELLEYLGRLCVRNIGQPDAGLWEIRDGWREHSFSNLMGWAGVERLRRIKELGYLKHFDVDLIEAKQRAEHALARAVRDDALHNGPEDDTFDASLLQLVLLHYPDPGLCRRTVERTWDQLKLGTDAYSRAFLYRYRRQDDFGTPDSAFLICSFWLVQALTKIDRRAEAVAVMGETLRAANDLGLFSEHFAPGRALQLGNFPQAYSHVGQINAAFAISPPWSDVF